MATYDALNRVIEEQYPGNVNDRFLAYDLAGRLLSVRYGSQSGQGVVYSYDTAGRLSTDATYGRAMAYGYDANGNRVKETWPDQFYVAYGYDALNRMNSIGQNGATSGLGLLATFTYDPLGRRTAISRGNGGTSALTYDVAGNLTGLSHTMPSAGSGDNLALTFSYTSGNQLASRISSNSVYDWSVVGGQSSCAAGGVRKTYDGLNRDASIAALSDGYDRNGGVTDDGVRKPTYDFEGRVTGVTVPATSTAVTLAYDPLGRLQQQQTTVGTGSPTTVQYLFDGPRLSAEYDGAGNLLRRYVHGPGTDEPVVWYEGASTSDPRWLHSDERGSIIAYANASGAVTTYSYGPYGEPQSWSGSRFAYTGQIMIPEIQLYHYKARTYDPVAGRFLQADPIGYAGGVNLYAYVGNDPFNATDPTGDCPDPSQCVGTSQDFKTSAGEAIDATGQDEIVVTAYARGTSPDPFGASGCISGCNSQGGSAQAGKAPQNKPQNNLGSLLKTLACHVGPIGGSAGADAYAGLGGSVSAGVTFNLANGQIEIPISTAVGVGWGLDGKFGPSISRSNPSGTDGIVSAGINYSIGGAAVVAGGSYSQQLIGTNRGSYTVSAGPAVGVAGYANIGAAGSFNFPKLYDLGCGGG